MDPLDVEMVSPPRGLSIHLGEIGPDGRHRVLAGPEPLELRMVPVSPGLAPQDLLGEQAFPPKGH
jgi:hypothetical protein